MRFAPLPRAVLGAPALLAALLAPIAAAGAEPNRTEPAPRGPAATTPAPRPTTLDDLFGRLAGTTDEGQAKGIAAQIERRFARSGSDTADLLAARAGEAMRAKDYPLAIELLDRVVALEPGWAEAWSRRAAAFYGLDDPASAMADLHQAIAREPRLFTAWAALGHIYAAGGDEARALASYRRALALYPTFGGLRAAVDRLAPEIDGRDL